MKRYWMMVLMIGPICSCVICGAPGLRSLLEPTEVAQRPRLEIIVPPRPIRTPDSSDSESNPPVDDASEPAASEEADSAESESSTSESDESDSATSEPDPSDLAPTEPTSSEPNPPFASPIAAASTPTPATATPNPAVAPGPTATPVAVGSSPTPPSPLTPLPSSPSPIATALTPTPATATPNPTLVLVPTATGTGVSPSPTQPPPTTPTSPATPIPSQPPSPTPLPPTATPIPPLPTATSVPPPAPTFTPTPAPDDDDDEEEELPPPASPPAANFELTDVVVGETNRTELIPVTLNWLPGTPYTVPFSHNDIETTLYLDYTFNGEPLTFVDNFTEHISLIIIDDALDEPDEQLRLGLPDGESMIVTIQDDDNPPCVQFEQSTYLVNEGDGFVALTVVLCGPSGFTVMVDYQTSDGTALASSDYTATLGTLTFNPGQTSQTITIPITNDTAYDCDQETLTVALSNPDNATLGSPATTTVTIANDDPFQIAVTDDNVVNCNCTLREHIIAANTDTAVDLCPAGSGGRRHQPGRVNLYLNRDRGRRRRSSNRRPGHYGRFND